MDHEAGVAAPERPGAVEVQAEAVHLAADHTSARSEPDSHSGFGGANSRGNMAVLSTRSDRAKILAAGGRHHAVSDGRRGGPHQGNPAVCPNRFWGRPHNGPADPRHIGKHAVTTELGFERRTIW